MYGAPEKKKMEHQSMRQMVHNATAPSARHCTCSYLHVDADHKQAVVLRSDAERTINLLDTAMTGYIKSTLGLPKRWLRTKVTCAHDSANDRTIRCCD